MTRLSAKMLKNRNLYVLAIYLDSRRGSPNFVREHPANVVPMPIGDPSVVAEFLRFHVLVRVFNGDPDAWLAKCERDPDSADLRFVRWIRSRLRQDPSLLGEIRRMVDATPFWRAAGA